MLRFAALTTLATCALAFSGSASALAGTCAGAETRPAPETLGQVASATLCLVNEQRSAAGLGQVTQQPQLDVASFSHSLDMVRDNYFAHDTPAGVGLVERLAAAGYALPDAGGWTAGENIAWGEGARSTPAEIVDAWMHSAGHRANILNDAYRAIGIGIVIGAPGGAPLAATYTTDFAARPAAVPANAAHPGKATAARKQPSAKTASRNCRTPTSRTTHGTRATRGARVSCARRSSRAKR